MWRNVAKTRTVWISLALLFAGLLIFGGVVAAKKLDLEWQRVDPQRLEALAADNLPAPPPSSSGDWPQWRGPERDGLSAEMGLLTAWPATGLRVLWKAPVGRGFSCVAVAGARLFTMEEDTKGTDAVICLDAASGKELWRYRYACQYWERFGSGPRSTPAVDGDRVYTVGPTGVFHCLRADTGAPLWRHDLADEFHARKQQYGVAFSPLVDGDLVYAMPGGPDGNSVAAFNKHTGALVWKALDDPVGYSSPIAITTGGVRQVLFFTNTALVSLSPADGKIFWRHPWQLERGFNIATPLAFGNYVFISTGYGKGCTLLEIGAAPDGSMTASPVYAHNRLRSYFSTSVRYGDHIYGFDMLDLVCMSVRTGAIVWREKGTRSFRKGSLTIADGHLIVLAENGTLNLADASPAGYQVHGTHSLTENKFWTPPAVAHGRLYVRSESEIVCLNLRRRR